ncbi:MAG: pyrroline-5-carboxylate reductase [Cytophagales bacterium]|nr:pyrroline-5-carboxylate reductase [Cytophagales bacterium]
MMETLTQFKQRIAFIGGGNMASAMIGGLLQAGMSAAQFTVVEPFEATRDKLQAAFGIASQAAADKALTSCDVVVWAVKPQSFKEAAAPVAPCAKDALHLSVAAGVTSDSIAKWLGTERIVRAMPNTPALIGQGITALFARGGVSRGDRASVDAVIGVTGQHFWLDSESKLDAVTAISGSGPAYVFYFLEAMLQAALDMGLNEAQARALATSTFAGSTALAASSNEPLALLRERVTSKGGTTYAALQHMEGANIKAEFVAAMQAAAARATEMGKLFV